jgi:general secretion pathway protein N
VQLLDTEGTVWRGSARALLAGGAGSQGSVALPGRVDWRLRPVWPGASLQLNAPCCMAEAMQLQVQAGAMGALVTVQNHRSGWPAAVLAGLGTPWNTVQAEGQLALATEGLSVEWAEGRWGLAGRVTLDATDMASRLSTLKPMGSYRLTIHGGSLNSLTLETLQGSLQLSGQGQWVGGRLRFDGLATALPEQQEALSNLLNIIGRREGARSVIKLG